MQVNLAGLAALPRNDFGPVPADGTSRRCRLTVLGCGTIASTTRSPVSYVLEDEDGLVLFDCNSRALTTFHQLGFDLTRLRTICIGHDHTDHSHGLVEWLEAIGTQCAMRGGLTPALQHIIGSKGLAAELDADIARHLPGYNDYLRNKFPALELREFAEMYRLSGGSCSITVYPTRHDDNLPSIGFQVSTPQGNITYPCDFGGLQEINNIADYLHRTDVMILDTGGRQPGEQTHLHISEAIDIAKRFKPGLLLASHIPDVTLANPLRAAPELERVRGAQKIIDDSGVKNVVIAQTGMYIDF